MKQLTQSMSFPLKCIHNDSEVEDREGNLVLVAANDSVDLQLIVDKLNGIASTEVPPEILMLEFLYSELPHFCELSGREQLIIVDTLQRAVDMGSAGIEVDIYLGRDSRDYRAYEFQSCRIQDDEDICDVLVSDWTNWINKNK